MTGAMIAADFSNVCQRVAYPFSRSNYPHVCHCILNRFFSIACSCVLLLASATAIELPGGEVKQVAPLVFPLALLQADAAAVADKPAETDGHWIQVRFPLTEADDRNLRLRIQAISGQAVVNKRPIVVIEFVSRDTSNPDPADGDVALEPIGRGTEFERALALARFLVGPVALRCRTVGYCSRDVEGHAVLVALACEEIAMNARANLGRVAIDEAAIDGVVIDAYQAIAKRRQNVPADAVTSMLDRDAGLFRVESTGGKIEFMSQARLEDKRIAGDVLSEDQLSVAGQLGNFSSQQMRKWLWIRQVVKDDQELKDSFGVNGWVVGGESLITGARKAGVVEIHGVVTEATVSRWMRAIDEIIRDADTNLLFLDIQSPGGDLAQSLRLAEYIADLDDSKVETIAWINGEALGDSVLIAMASDRLYVKPGSKVGGPGEASIKNVDIESLTGKWQDLARRVQRTPGELYSLLCPTLPIHEFQAENGRKEVGTESIFFANNAHPNWKIADKVKVDLGMTTEELVQRRWAKGLEGSLKDLATTWGLNQLPEPKRVSRIEQIVQRIAGMEWLASLLLIASFTLITNEFTSPGIGVPGFLALICFSLFVWMRVLGGTVEWLEIILIGAGILCIAIEIFVLPGFGVFGFGGLILLVSGIVLASQTFVVPTNEYQWRSTAWHTSQVAIACLSVFAMLYWMKDHLEQLPFFRWLKLEPPAAEVFDESQSNPLASLVGEMGVTTTMCTPYGKARFATGYFDVHSQDGLIGSETTVKVIGVSGKSMDVVRVDPQVVDSPLVVDS